MQKRNKKGLLRRSRWFLLAACIFVAWIAAIAVAGWHCSLQGRILPHSQRPSARVAVTADIKGYVRSEDESYLSYPEWYIVWSYQEKADYQRDHLPSGFPYFSAARQYWTTDCCISRAIRGQYGFNVGEEVMLAVLGSSFSAEYILKGSYENTIGRLSEWSSGREPVEEDHYAAKMAADYAGFVHVRPFYEYHFARHVPGLWRETHFWGHHPVRKWERKMFLSVDYAAEAFYAWIIEKVTRLTYGYEPADTPVWVASNSSRFLLETPRIKLIRQVDAGQFIVDIPRYQEFTSVASDLTSRDVSFIEIAGNSQVLISVLAPHSWHFIQSGAQELFSTPVLTDSTRDRVAINSEVTALHSVLNALRQPGVSIEHIYDY